MPTTEEIIEQLRILAESGPETRSRRMQILVTPTMYESLKVLADGMKVSMNEIVNVALEEYLKGKK